MHRLPYVLFLAVLLYTLSAREHTVPHSSVPAFTSSNYGIYAEEVRINTGAVTISGTLLMPHQSVPAPAVIIIPGSGAATRNGSWNMYLKIGEYLGGRGVAVLIYDKRGVGGSTGNWKSETFDERAQDVATLMRYLQSRVEIDPTKIGLIGHSQGAYIAPLVVAKYSNDVKLVVMLAGPGQSVWDQVLMNERMESLRSGYPISEVETKVTALENQLEFLDKFQVPCRMIRAHYLCFVIDYDPTFALQNLTVPTLALYAELDTQVPPEVNIPLLEAALLGAGNKEYAIHTFEKTNHWFAQAENGTTTEMRETMQESGFDHYDFVPGFLNMIGDWITALFFTSHPYCT